MKTLILPLIITMSLMLTAASSVLVAQRTASYDEDTFKSIIYDTGHDDFGGYVGFITPYLDCYAKKHNISQDTVDTWPKVHRADDDQALALGQQRLAELETKLRSRMKSFPDTGLGPDSNPAIYFEIATKRAEYLACFRGAGQQAGDTDCKSNPLAEVHLTDLEKTRKEAEEFRPGLREYFVSTLSDSKNLYLEAALSPSAREEWLGRFRENDPKFEQCMKPALDQLAAVARKTLPSYTGPAGYTPATPAEKNALLGAIDDIAKAKVFKVAIKEANWLIDKNSLGIPNSRFKHGVIWAQYPNSDDGFCRIFWVNVVQDYAGGGTYGASQGNFVGRSFAGCPSTR
jgi:hypothetical protein